MALFPGVPRAVTRNLAVTASAADVMRWLSDSGRREANWRSQTTRTAPRLRRRSSWLCRQSIQVEPAGDAAGVRVRVRGRPARLTIVTHFLLSEDSTQALRLTRLADKLADSTTSAVQRQFTTAREPG